MHVQTDHQIIARGLDVMVLVDFLDGSEVVKAERVPVVTGSQGAYVEKPMWIVGAPGTSNETVESRTQAVAAMTEMALAVLPGDGYSTLVPHGLTDLP